MADIAELTVRIKADAAQLQAEMKKVQTTVQQATGGMNNALGSFKSQLATLAPAIGAAAFVTFAKNALNAADRLNDLSQRSGVAASTLSALNIPLLQGGSNVEEFASSINRMNNAIGEARNNQALTDTFNQLGLSIEKLRNLSPEQQFYEISKALNEVKNQADFTKLGMDIFGRSFSSLAPLIRESNGNLDDFVKTAKATGKAISEEDLKRIDEFGDKWTAAIEGMKLSIVNSGIVELLGELYDIAKAVAAVPEMFSYLGNAAGKSIRRQITGLPDNASTVKPATLSNEEAAASVAAGFAKMQGGKASGSNPNIKAMQDQAKAIDAARKSLDEYNTQLTRSQAISGLTAKEQAGMEVYYKTLDLAQKAQIKNAVQIAEANRDIAESTYEFAEAQQEATRRAEEMRTQLSDALADAIIDFRSAGDAATQFARQIASTIIKQSITNPLANAIVGNGSSGSGLIGSILGSIGLPSFDVGSPYVPNDMVAKIHKGEMIIPAVQADAIRSGKSSSGGGVTVVQNNNFASGVTRQEVAGMMPQLMAATKSAVFAEIQKGGAASKIVGVR